MLVTSKAVFLENYLEVSTWILNGPSIECLEKNYQPFSSAGVRFGSLVNQIFGLKSAWHRSGLCLTLLLCNCWYKWIIRNNLRNQTDTIQLKNNARTRTSFCVRKKKLFLRLIAGRLSFSPGNRKNFFAVLCGNTLKERDAQVKTQSEAKDTGESQIVIV